MNVSGSTIFSSPGRRPWDLMGWRSVRPYVRRHIFL